MYLLFQFNVYPNVLYTSNYICFMLAFLDLSVLLYLSVHSKCGITRNIVNTRLYLTIPVSLVCFLQFLVTHNFNVCS